MLQRKIWFGEPCANGVRVSAVGNNFVCVCVAVVLKFLWRVLQTWGGILFVLRGCPVGERVANKGHRYVFRKPCVR
eukprot:11217437-Lingulodinium_polyedra.AAC.1